MGGIAPVYELADHAPRERVSDTARPKATGLLSWRDLQAQSPDPPPQLCPGIPLVGVTVLAGAPKVGKTLLASQRALETGKTALLIIEEGSLAGISYRLRRQAEDLNVDEPPLSVLHRHRVRLDNAGSVRRVRDLVASLRPSIVVMDPLNRLHGADENRPTQMTPVMDALAGIAYDSETAVLAIHHLAKPSQERRGDIWDRFRGASAIRSGTDANLAMDGTGDVIRLVGEFRDAEPMSEYLELDRAALMFRTVDGPKAVGKVNPDELRAYVVEQHRVTARQVMERFDVKSKATALRALEDLDGIDWFDGARNQRFYTFGTVQ
jgi:AAA domain